MKVVLFGLNASYSHTSLAVRCLREPLEKAGFDVVLLEKNTKDSFGDLLHTLYEQRADIYGFSCYLWNITVIEPLARNLHALLPGSKIIFGGPEVSYETERFEETFPDFIIGGPGEKAIVTICTSVRDGLPCPRFVREAEEKGSMEERGILYRNGEMIEGKILYYESSRGCPYHCSYCLSSVTEGIGEKSVQKTLDDLLAFESLNVPFKIIKFVDRTFNYNAERANAIWRGLLSEKYTKHYHFEVCASLLNEESFAILEQFPAGKIQLEIGLQSTHPQTLSEISRHLNPEKILKASERIHKKGNIHVHLDLIAGLPYETYEIFQKSFNDAYGKCHQLQLGFLKLLRGTALREKADSYGYVFRTDPPYTVLQSRWISYEELYFLSQVSDLLERYYDRDSFLESLPFAVQRAESPFRFYEGFQHFLEGRGYASIRSVSQQEAFRMLFLYARSYLGPQDLVLFKGIMIRDYTKREARKPPASLFV